MGGALQKTGAGAVVPFGRRVDRTVPAETAVTKSAGLLEGDTAAILADESTSQSLFYWKVEGDVLFNGSTIRTDTFTANVRYDF